ncbi:hypothetical protein BX666DRAFT_2109857, partial [Dichotomocladium elegans]
MKRVLLARTISSIYKEQHRRTNTLSPTTHRAVYFMMARMACAVSLLLVAFSAPSFAAPFGHRHCSDHEHHHHHHHHHHGLHDHLHATPCSTLPDGCLSSPPLVPAHDISFFPDVPEPNFPSSSGPEIHSQLPNLEDALDLATGGSVFGGANQEAAVSESTNVVTTNAPSEPYTSPEEQPFSSSSSTGSSSSSSTAATAIRPPHPPNDSFPIQGDVDRDDADDDNDEDGDDSEE